MDLLWEFNKKYLSQLDYDPTDASLGKSFYDKYLSLSAVSNDIHPKATSLARPPSPRDLLHSSFGKPSASHSFVQDACFEKSYVLVLKSGFFEPADILALHRCHPLLRHLLCTCVHLRHYNFLWLAQYNLDWDKQQSLGCDKAYAFLVCLLHYNLSIASTIRFLGNNYTGTYCDIPSIFNSLRVHGIAESLILHYSRIMTVGCPNHLNTLTSCNNALLYWRKGNHPSICTKINQVMSTMNKEEKITTSYTFLIGSGYSCHTASSHRSTSSRSPERRTAKSSTPLENTTGLQCRSTE
jgi:hypothetical protein